MSYGEFYLYDSGILETVVNQGTEIDVQEIDELKQILLSIKPQPKLILANRMNSYSLTFKAILTSRDFPHIDAVAELRPNTKINIFSGKLAPLFFKLALFTEREEAIEWLIKKKF